MMPVNCANSRSPKPWASLSFFICLPKCVAGLLPLFPAIPIILPQHPMIITECCTLVTRFGAAEWTAAPAIQPPGRRLDGATANESRKAMDRDSDDFTAMDDPEFLAERRRVRETLAALTERYQKINEEFDRRAGTGWASAS